MQDPSVILSNLGKAKYFSTIDLESGFHQILMREADIEKTSFSINNGKYEFLRMPFGLTVGQIEDFEKYATACFRRRGLYSKLGILKLNLFQSDSPARIHFWLYKLRHFRRIGNQKIREVVCDYSCLPLFQRQICAKHKFFPLTHFSNC